MTTKKYLIWTSTLSFVLALIPVTVFSQDRVVESSTHRFVEVAQGVWHVSGNGKVHTMSNVMVLVGEFDTLVVDSHVTPSASRALLASLPVITDKPVRYLINSHYHFDHAHGNQSFPAGVEIIGHEFTRAKLNGDIGNVLEENTFKSFSDPVPSLVLNLEERLEQESNPAREAELREQLRVQTDYMKSIPEVSPTPPNITLRDKMTLFQVVADGSREIQLLHFGRAHTGGDVVVYLPKERVAFTGDMMLPGLAYMGDGHVDEWPATLEGLKGLEFEIWLPGHGPVMHSKEPINNFQAYLRDLWGKVELAHSRGTSWEDASGEIDMTNHAENYMQIRAPGVDPRAVRRIYQLLDDR